MVISTLQKAKISRQIKTKAKDLGCHDCGISPAGALTEDASRTEAWLSEGMHGEMTWMERNKDKRYDPRNLVEDAKSVITILYGYAPKERLPETDNYKISNYAYGADYHTVVKDKLYQLLKFIEQNHGKRKARVFVDSAPVMDRVWAYRSGLGFVGKNTMLINRKGGSYFFIGHIILDMSLAYEPGSPEKSFCGSCTLCLQACPTQALEPFVLDARKCISYLTIEHRSELPEKYRDQMNDWIFGCDICQQVCPWNRDVKHHQEPEFSLSGKLKSMRKKDWHALDERRFEELFSKSAVQRTGFRGLKRNIDFIRPNRLSPTC